MQRQYLTCTIALLLAITPADTRAYDSDQAVTTGSIAAAAVCLCGYGIYEYRNYAETQKQHEERSRIERIHGDLWRDTQKLEQRLKTFINVWNQLPQMAFHDWLTAFFAAFPDETFDDTYKELNKHRDTINHLCGELQSAAKLSQAHNMHAQIQEILQRASEAVEKLRPIITYMNEHYALLSMFDLLYGSERLHTYYSTSISYYEAYPDPQRIQYVDQALVSQCISAGARWPRIAAISHMSDHMRELEQNLALLEKAVPAYPPQEYQYARALCDEARWLLHYLQTLHMNITAIPAYHQERDSYYQYKQEEERERQRQALHKKQIEAEQEKAAAEHKRARAEEDRFKAEQRRYQEEKKKCELQRELLRWGYHRLPEVQERIYQLAHECYQGASHDYILHRLNEIYYMFDNCVTSGAKIVIEA